ncbi:MAG: carboxypeptidase-like regulatory domain-containing protein [Planctomycetota bacterium]
MAHEGARTATIAGRVVLLGGASCPDAIVRGTGGRNARADAEGRFEMSVAGPGEVVLVASADGLVGRPSAPIRLGDDDVVNVVLVAEPAASLGGIVSDASGRPIGGIEVQCRTIELGIGDDWAREVSHDLIEPAVATTDESGRFHVPTLHDGLIEVVASPIGYLGAARRVRTDGTDVELTLVRLPELHGRVVDAETGAPVPYSSVVLLGERGRGASEAWFPLDDATCRREGVGGETSFRLWPRVQRAVRVAVHADGYEPGTSDPVHMLGADVGPVEVELVAARPLSGRVVGDDGEPIAGAVVSVGDGGQAEGSTGARSSTTTDDGRFSVAAGADGAIAVSVEAEGHLPYRSSHMVTHELSDVLLIELRRAGAIHVEVPGAVGIGSGLWLSLRQGGELATDRPTREIPDDGTAEFVSIPPGEYEVALHAGPVVRSAAAEAVMTVTTVVAAGAASEVRLDAPTATSMGGTLSLDGVPSPMRRVRWLQRDGTPIARSTTDRGGRFALAAFGADPAWLEVALSPRAAAHHRRAIDREPGSEDAIELKLETGRLVGRVASEADGGPVAGATVLLEALPVGGAAEPFDVVTLRIDADGRFDSSTVVAGPVLLTVRAPYARSVERRPVEVLSGGLTDLGDVLLLGGGDLEVVVRSPHGVIGARDEFAVEVAPSGSGDGPIVQRRVGAGRVTFQGVGAGEAQVRVVAADGTALTHGTVEVQVGARSRLVLQLDGR